MVKHLVIAHIASGVKSGQLTHEFLSKVLGVEDLDALLNDDEEAYYLNEALTELLGMACEYDGDFMRVISYVKLYIIEEEIQIPSVKALDML